MNIQELLEQAKSLYAEARKAIEEGNLELADGKQKEADAVKAKIKALKAADDGSRDLEGLTPDPEPAPEPKTKKNIQRLPFDTADDAPEPEDSFAKSFYVLKYGDIGAAEKAVLTDLYSKDYNQKRHDQHYAFAKYVRTGRLSFEEQVLLKTLILMPESVRQEIKMGSTVADIKATLQEGVADLGGYLVPEDYRLEIIKRMMGMTVVRGRARQVQTVRDAAEWPKLEGGNSQYTSAVRVTWVDEVPASATVAQTNPTFGMYRIPVHVVMARTDLSKNMLEDSAFNLLQVVSELFAEAMAIDEDQRFLTGTGGGTPRGILGNRSGANETPETGIETVNTSDASAVTADGLINLVYGLHAQYRGNAILVGARNTHRDIRKLKDGNGDYLWEKGLRAGEPPTLLGYPFLESESMPAIAANNYPVIFGDLRGYLIVDRVGMSVSRVEDTTTEGTNTVALFARRRLGGQVVEPWRFQGHKVSA